MAREAREAVDRLTQQHKQQDRSSLRKRIRRSLNPGEPVHSAASILRNLDSTREFSL